MEFEIDTDVPLPERAKSARGAKKRQYPFGELGVGNSFLVPDKTESQLRSQMYKWRLEETSRIHLDFYVKSVNDDPNEPGARCWRVEDRYEAEE